MGWFEAEEAKFFSPDLVQDAVKKVKLILERMHTAQNRHKSYVDPYKRDLEFQE